MIALISKAQNGEVQPVRGSVNFLFLGQCSLTFWAAQDRKSHRERRAAVKAALMAPTAESRPVTLQDLNTV